VPLVLDLIAASVLGALALIAALAYPRAADPTVSGLGRAVAAQPAGTQTWVRRTLASRLDRSVASGLLLTLALAVAIAGGVVLGVLAYLIRSLSATQGIDNAVAAWGFRHRSPLSTHGLHLITDLGAFQVVIALAAVVLVFDFVRSRGRWCAPFLLAVLVGEEILTWSVKDLAGRVRPTFDPAAAGLGPSFPSGHSATSAAFYAAAALVLGRFAPRPARVTLIALAVAIAAAVASSRVLLDLHWLSDVVGGLALGWAWFALCAVMFGGRLLRPTAGIELAARAAGGTGAALSAESGADEDVLEELTGPPSGAPVDVPRRSALERQP
jgi:undecaprenyl-diphosphatase